MWFFNAFDAFNAFDLQVIINFVFFQFFNLKIFCILCNFCCFAASIVVSFCLISWFITIFRRIFHYQTTWHLAKNSFLYCSWKHTSLTIATFHHVVCSSTIRIQVPFIQCIIAQLKHKRSSLCHKSHEFINFLNLNKLWLLKITTGD